MGTLNEARIKEVNELVQTQFEETFGIETNWYSLGIEVDDWPYTLDADEELSVTDALDDDGISGSLTVHFFEKTTNHNFWFSLEKNQNDFELSLEWDDVPISDGEDILAFALSDTHKEIDRLQEQNQGLFKLNESLLERVEELEGTQEGEQARKELLLAYKDVKRHSQEDKSKLLSYVLQCRTKILEIERWMRPLLYDGLVQILNITTLPINYREEGQEEAISSYCTNLYIEFSTGEEIRVQTFKQQIRVPTIEITWTFGCFASTFLCEEKDGVWTLLFPESHIENVGEELTESSFFKMLTQCLELRS